MADVLFYERDEREAIQWDSFEACLADGCAALQSWQESASYRIERKGADLPPPPAAVPTTQPPRRLGRPPTHREIDHEIDAGNDQEGPASRARSAERVPIHHAGSVAPRQAAHGAKHHTSVSGLGRCAATGAAARTTTSRVAPSPRNLKLPPETAAKRRRQLELRDITGTEAESLGFSDDTPEGWAFSWDEGPKAEVERRTWGHRRGLARHHDAVAHVARRQARAVELQIGQVAAGKVPEQLLAELQAKRNRAKWHRDRARGQRERFHNHAKCSMGVGVVRCESCGHEHGIQVGCGVSRLCVACRDRRAQQRRAQLWRAREQAIARCKAKGRMLAKRRGGPWGEWHLVLTMPDQRIGAPADRIHTLFAAWRTFSRLWQRYQSGRTVPGAAELPRRPGSLDDKPRQRTRTARGFSGTGGAYWSRCFEWTPGADGRGHPHFHTWILGPRVGRDLVRSWWALALQALGVPVRDTDPLVHLSRAVVELVVHEVHKGNRTIKNERIRATDKAGHVLGYVEGWAVAERDPKSGYTATAKVQADVYMALESRRHVQTSRGLMKLGAQLARCPTCGGLHVLSVEIHSWRDRDLLELARKWKTWPDVVRLPSRGPLRAIAKLKRRNAA